MKKRIQLKSPAERNLSASYSVRTGDHCPATGWWARLGDGGTRRFITEGSIMPSANGEPSNWKLLVSNHHPYQVPRHDLPSKENSLDAI
ncbi:hypothetical protein [Pseudarthrobacter sp. TAF60_1]|uniref:hypothetical protein n=1 Tax=Pseudarthrobacter sp. TAF60_1 TaxID=3233071 RepID=UPI003F9CA269